MRVLAVEDNPVSQSLLKNLVSGLGFEFHCASNGREGLELYQNLSPSLVMCDINMPEMDGFELVEMIRRDDPDTVILIMTGYGSETTAIKSMRLGANDYLQKPISVKELSILLAKYQAMITERNRQQAVFHMIEKKHFSLCFQTDMRVLSDITDQLVFEAAGMLDKDSRLGVRLALFELLMNAVEHGNLEITMEEKRCALEQNSFSKLCHERMQDENKLLRKIFVDFEYSRDTGCKWTIRDEGKGFDYHSLPGSLEFLQSVNGRGIYLAKTQFDEIEYFGCGNTVAAFKKPI